MPNLIFVYNANSGIGNAILDVAHKIFSPKTYACNLCAITFDTFSENKSWKAFRENSLLDMEFLHIDEFEKEYKNQAFTYPIILSKNNNHLSILLSAEAINKLGSVEDLISLIESELAL